MKYYINIPAVNRQSSDSTTLQAFDSYYTAPLEISSSTLDAVKGFFENKGFDKISSEAVAIAIIRQAKVDGVNPMTVLDTMKTLDTVQMSNVVSEILNYNRYKTSFLGYVPESVIIPEVARNIESPIWVDQYDSLVLLTESGLPITDEGLDPLEEG